MNHLDDSSPVNLAQHFLHRHVEEGRGARTALLTRERAWSYAELSELCRRVATVFNNLGVRRGDRVLLALADCPEFVAAWYAAHHIGAVTAEVYTFLQAKDYAYYLAYTEAAIVVADSTTLPRIREAMELSGRHHVLVCAGDDADDDDGHGVVSLQAALREATPDTACAPTRAGEPAIWKFTTGSTGRPKACVHPARSPLVSFASYALGVLGMREDDVVLPVPKLFFGYARDLAALFPFGAGARGIAFAERSTPELIFELIERHRPTILVNVPTMMQAMLEHPSGSGRDLSSLRLCTSAGEALPTALHRRWLDRFGVEVLDGIGSSEAYHIYISNRPGRVRIGSMGECVPGYSADVVDETGQPLADGETGRLHIHGDTTALMYWGDEERSRATFGERLVRSGDLASRDTDGFFWYRGRADDLLKIGGVWVAPAEIEQCLVSHPGVVECAVIGLERDGLTVSCAYVVARSGAVLEPDELRLHVRSHLAPHKTPGEVRVVAALPLTGSGKVDRAALRAEALREVMAS